MTKLAIEYGEGLYALAREESLTGRLMDELNETLQVFSAAPEYARLLGNQSIAKPERLQVLDAALRGQVHPYLLSFLKILCERGAIHELRDCMKAYQRLYYEENRISEAVVTSAAELTGEQRSQLLSALEKKTGRKIVLREKTDASLLGGVLLEMDGKRIDGTLRHRLASLQSLISGNA